MRFPENRAPWKILSIFCTFVLLSGCLAVAQSPWKAVESGGIVHFFFFNGSNKIERYNLASETWMSAITPTPPLGSSMTAGWVDDDGLYLGFDKTLRRYNRNGGGETHLRNTSANISDIISDTTYILISYSSSFLSIRKSDNSLAADESVGYYSAGGFSIDPGIRTIYGRTKSSSPSDVLRLPYNADGTFESWVDSPHHGSYPSAVKTFLFPGGGRVVDNSGTLYQASSLAYIGSLAGSLNDIQFYENSLPIVLRGNQLSAYSNGLLETGTVSLAQTCYTIGVKGDRIIAFYPNALSASGTSTIATQLSALNPATPGPAVDPKGARYTPDAVFQGNDGLILLFSKTHQSIFRWDPATQSYAGTIPLVKNPTFATYSPSLNRIYTGLPSGEIRMMDLNAASPVDAPFYNLPSSVLGMTAAGDFLFAVDASGAWESHYVISSSGALLSSEEWRTDSRVFEWSPVNSKVYHFRDGSSPNDLIQTPISAQGILGEDVDSPYHGGVGTVPPIRIAGDGSVVVLGSGEVFNGTTLARAANNLPTAFVDGNWTTDGNFATIRNYNSQSLVERYSANYGVVDYVLFNGVANRLLPLSDNRLLAISLEAEVPVFRLFDSNLDLIDSNPVAAPPAPTGLTKTSSTTSSISIAWNPVMGATGYVIERESAPSTWVQVSSVAGGSVSSATISGLQIGTSYSFRMRASNSAGNSVPSATLVASTDALSVPIAPATLSKLGGTENSLTLGWTTVSGASGYKIEQLQAPSTWVVVKTISGQSTSSTQITGLASQTSYTFRARAYNAAGDSLPSPQLVATTNAAATPPQTTFFEITFEEAKHVVGQAPAIGGTDSPSQIVDGTPEVVNFGGSKVLKFNAPLTSGVMSSEGIRLNLDRNVSNYVLEYDLYLDNLVASPLAVGELFKTSMRDNAEQSLYFQPNTNQGVRYFQSSPTHPTPPALSGTLGTYVHDKWYQVKIEVDTVAKTWVITIDGEQKLSGPIYITSDINEILFSLLDREGGADAIVYLDNITVRNQASAGGGYDLDFPIQPNSSSDLSTHFDMNWDSDPHVVGQRTAMGAPTGPSSVPFGSPIVAASHGELTNRPLVFQSGESSNHYEQIMLSLNKGNDIYAASMDLQISGEGPEVSDGFTMFIDASTANWLDFLPNGSIQLSTGSVGNFTPGQAFQLRFLVDVQAKLAYFSVDGGPFVSRTISITSGDISSIRYSLIDSSDGDATVALDNVRVMGFDLAATVPVVPGAPTMSPVTNIKSNRLTLNWLDNDNLETGFLIERRQGTGSWEAIGSVGPNIVTYVDGNLTPSSQYSYRVFAVNAVGSSPASAIVSPNTAASLLPPSTFQLISSTDTSLQVSWGASSRATGYRIEVSLPGGWEVLKSITGAVTSTVLGGLTPNQTYLLRIIAKGDDEPDSQPSVVLTATTLPQPAPTGVQASDGLYGDKVVVNWAAVTGALSYEVFRNQFPNGAGSVSIGTVTGTSFEDRTLDRGVVYYYAVQVTTANGTSGFSQWNNGSTTMPLPLPPDIVSATLGDHTNRVVLNWNAGPNATSYNIYRSNSPDNIGSFLATTTLRSYSDNLVLPGQLYYYRVNSKNSAGDSIASSPVPGYARLAAVTGFSVSYHRNDGVLLSWEGVVGANSYSIFRSATNDIESAVFLALTEDLRFLDATAEIDSNYFYFVRGENGAVLGGLTEGEEGVRLSAPGYLPDLLHGGSAAALQGDNQYGMLNSVSLSKKGRPVNWVYRLENDGLLNDDLTFVGGKGDRNFKVVYTGAKGNVTANVVTTGYRLSAVDAGASDDIQMRVSPAVRRGKKAKKAFTASLVSTGDRASRDASVTTIQVK